MMHLYLELHSIWSASSVFLITQVLTPVVHCFHTSLFLSSVWKIIISTVQHVQFKVYINTKRTCPMVYNDNISQKGFGYEVCRATHTFSVDNMRVDCLELLWCLIPNGMFGKNVAQYYLLTIISSISIWKWFISYYRSWTIGIELMMTVFLFPQSRPTLTNSYNWRHGVVRFFHWKMIIGLVIRNFTKGAISSSQNTSMFPSSL